MTGTSSPMPLPPARRPLKLTRRGRAVLAVGAACVLALGVVAAVPHLQQDAAAAASGPEAVTGPVHLNADLVAQRTSLARAGGTRTRVPVVVTAIVTAPASSRPVLRPGNKGPAVAFVQKALHVKQTGWYGPLTLRAVVAFQKAHGLPSQGYVGPRTWAALLAPAKAAARPAKAAARAAAPSAPVRSGRVCPAPGASFGQGWGAQRAGHKHQGMDLMGRRGLPLLAIEAGVVIREGRQSNGALRIVLQGTSGSKFYYGHMSKDLVHAGSRVRRGQVIGLMGDSGSPGAVHLHFEFWRSGGESAAVDPGPLLRSIC